MKILLYFFALFIVLITFIAFGCGKGGSTRSGLGLGWFGSSSSSGDNAATDADSDGKTTARLGSCFTD